MREHRKSPVGQWLLTLLLLAVVFGGGTALTLKAVKGTNMGTPSTLAAAGATATTVKNPKANLTPSPNYVPTCNKDGENSTPCRTQVLAAIQHAHKVEGIRPITLPKNFWSLSTTDQLFVIVDLERVDRGLKPVLGLTSALDSTSLTAALRLIDPILAGWSTTGDAVQLWGSIWAASVNSLDADYEWMYEDGWGGTKAATSNFDCTSASASGCWGHREIILGSYQHLPLLIAGAGSVAKGWKGVDQSNAEIIVGATGKQPKYTYSWATAKKHGA